MKAAIVAVGSELLGSDRLDTNSLRIAALLDEFGVALERKAQVSDHEEAMVAQLAEFARAYPLVVITGGLGPTADDRTREALAVLTGRALYESAEVAAAIEARFCRFGRVMPAVNRRQAQVLAGAEVLPNERGTAPGLRVLHGGATLFAFPGVPYELEGFLAGPFRAWLERHADRAAGHQRVTAATACLPESQVEELLQPLYQELGRDAIMVLAKPGEVTVSVAVPRAAPRLFERIDAVRASLRRSLGDALYDDGLVDGGGRTLEATVGDLLLRRGATVVSAESCTGGWLGQRFTAVAGSSRWYLGGVVAYSNSLKQQLLGVPEAALREHGAVSEPVARAMAEGARARLGGDHALAITGVAGPGGGSADKPVGTVMVALASAGAETLSRRLLLPGDRERVRAQSTQWALDLLRRRLLGLRALEVAAPGAAPPATTTGERG